MRLQIKITLLLLLLANCLSMIHAQEIGIKELSTNPIIGQWKTIDDSTHKARSIVEIYIIKNKLYGKIIEIFPQQGKTTTPICEKCRGALKNQPIVGLQIINGLSLKDGKWQSGEILDPNNGKNYSCKIWLESGKLKVRGYIGFFFRTQEWLKHEPSVFFDKSNSVSPVWS